MALSADEHPDIEKSAIAHNEAKNIDGSSNDSSNVVDAYAPPENTTWKTWVVIFVSSVKAQRELLTDISRSCPHLLVCPSGLSQLHHQCLLL
jgi:hypothetical protein